VGEAAAIAARGVAVPEPAAGHSVGGGGTGDRKENGRDGQRKDGAHGSSPEMAGTHDARRCHKFPPGEGGRAFVGQTRDKFADNGNAISALEISSRRRFFGVWP